MKCPVCTDSTLVMSDRQGIEIDYCPACRGVWLDRGELDKIIERSVASDPGAAAAPMPAAPPPPADPRTLAPPPGADPRMAPAPPPPGGYGRYRSPDSSARYGGYGHQGRRKRRGFLDELFDF